MFGFFKNKKAPKDTDASHGDGAVHDPATAALLKQIAEQKQSDPLIGLKIGAEEAKAQIYDAIRDKSGINVDIALRILSALAGFSCQMAIREAIIHTGKATEADVFTVLDVNGEMYYAGGLLNKPLVEDKFSVWGLIGGGVQEAGGQLPDLKAIAEYGMQSLGTENFGWPRVHEKYLAGDSSINYVRLLWPQLLLVIDMFCESPVQRPVLLGLAIQKIIVEAKEVIDPHTAGILCMDTAVATSKISPELVGVSR